jgi:ribose/xylose/arabinose/galactoside ABC-type transport system permease subunit
MINKLRSANLGLLWFYLVIIVVFSLLSPPFRTLGNLQNLLSGFSHIGIMAVGMAFPLLLGGIDLSVGAIMGLVGMVMLDIIMLLGVPGWAAVPIGLAVGALAGLINAVLIVRLGLQPFIATLATMVAYRGITYTISGRQLVPELSVLAITDPFYTSIDGAIGPLPLAFLYLVVLAALTHLLLRYTRFGMDVYAVGGNETAARLAGMNVNRVKVAAYTISGVCTAVAALILTSRLTTSTEDLGFTFEMSAIAAAIIGGVSLRGGVGSTIGPALGAFLIGTIYIGLTLVGITTYAQPVVVGVVLIGAVGYDRLMEARRARALLERRVRETHTAVGS